MANSLDQIFRNFINRITGGDDEETVAETRADQGGLMAPRVVRPRARPEDVEPVGGAVTGAYLGRGDPMTATAGAVVGMFLGHEIGAMFDKVDQIHATMLLRQTLSNNTNGQMSTWSNPDKGFAVTQGPVATRGNCREFVSKVAVGKQLRNIRGTACLENNEWIMKEVYE